MVCFSDLSGGLEISFQIFKCLNILFICWVWLDVSGCARSFYVPAPVPRQDRPGRTGIPEKDQGALSPRAQASLRLTEQGRALLESGRPDDAIGMLEQAINLNPANGLNYYYLSEAWLFKGRLGQAEEFNGLAELYLEESPEWRRRVKEQRKRIEALNR